MNTHPYLRAYMAGVTVPTAFLLMIMIGFFIARHVYSVPIPIERVIVFPMAIIPNMFGIWNILYVRLKQHYRVSIGVHGVLLPFVLLPIALAIARSLGFLTLTLRGLVWFDVVSIPYTFLAILFPMVVIIYYFVWKYLVGFLNGLLGVE